MYRTLCSALIVLAACTGQSAWAENRHDGLVVLDSAFDVATTMDRLEAVVRDKGMNVFGRINHAANAETVDLQLPPTEVLIFGNPRVGTPLMTCSLTVAIDLPQKILVWQDSGGQVRLAYNDPAWMRERHASDGCDEVFDKVAGALAAFAEAATRAD